MAKTWNELTQSEKVEDLRKDGLAIIEEFNSMKGEFRHLSGRVGEIERTLSSGAKT